MAVAVIRPVLETCASMAVEYKLRVAKRAYWYAAVDSVA